MDVREKFWEENLKRIGHQHGTTWTSCLERKPNAEFIVFFHE
jgi:hypothetical protein